MFSYQVNKNIKLKILEEREAEQLFKLVDSNRDYLAEFLPFVKYTKKVEDSKILSIQHYNSLREEMDFHILISSSFWVLLIIKYIGGIIIIFGYQS